MAGLKVFLAKAVAAVAALSFLFIVSLIASFFGKLIDSLV